HRRSAVHRFPQTEPRRCPGKSAPQCIRHGMPGDIASIHSRSKSLPSLRSPWPPTFELNARSINADLTVFSTLYWKYNSRVPSRNKHIVVRQRGHRHKQLFTVNCGEVLQFCVVLTTFLPTTRRTITSTRPPWDDTMPACPTQNAGGRSLHFHKTNREETPCRARPRSTRSCVRKATRRKFPAWLPSPQTAKR